MRNAKQRNNLRFQTKQSVYSNALLLVEATSERRWSDDDDEVIFTVGMSECLLNLFPNTSMCLDEPSDGAWLPFLLHSDTLSSANWPIRLTLSCGQSSENRPKPVTQVNTQSNSHYDWLTGGHQIGSQSKFNQLCNFSLIFGALIFLENLWHFSLTRFLVVDETKPKLKWTRNRTITTIEIYSIVFVLGPGVARWVVFWSQTDYSFGDADTPPGIWFNYIHLQDININLTDKSLHFEHQKKVNETSDKLNNDLNDGIRMRQAE